jgi:hypothetical protein
MPRSERLRDTIRRLVELLVAKDYDEIERFTRGVRLSAESLREAVRRYGHELVVPPEEAFERLDIIEMETPSDPRKWSVRFDLWTKEEGRSDLTLELTIFDGGEIGAEVDDLHVL